MALFNNAIFNSLVFNTKRKGRPLGGGDKKRRQRPIVVRPPKIINKFKQQSLLVIMDA